MTPAIKPKMRKATARLVIELAAVFLRRRMSRAINAKPGRIRIESPDTRAAIEPRYPSRVGNCVRHVKGITKPVAKAIDLRSMARHAMKTPIISVIKLKNVRNKSAKFEIAAASIAPVNGLSKKP